MKLSDILPRFHLFEIADQRWCPSFVRTLVQTALTEIWCDQIPAIQSASPAKLVATIIQQTLGSDTHDYTFIDFCSGSGGPTPVIEDEMNARLALQSRETMKADFILTDLHPDVSAWREASRSSRAEALHYVPTPVDALRADSKDLVQLVLPASKRRGDKTFRLFSLSFHHFDDKPAAEILRKTLLRDEGFAIFELQGRVLVDLIFMLVMFPFIVLGSWFDQWGNWARLFWTGVVPVLPIVFAFDGFVSCLRTRTESELMDLIKHVAKGLDGGIDGWTFESGERLHAWPTGKLRYLIGVKKGI